MRIDLTFDPVIAQLGPLQIGWHGVLTALAIVVAVWLGLRIAERNGLPTEPLGELATWSIIGGIVGARLFHVLDHLPYYLSQPLAALAIWEGGIAAYGAFVGGVVVAVFLARRMGIPRWTLLDSAAPAMLVGQAIGRLGCLANGDAWGSPCSGSDLLCVVYWHPNALLPANLRGVPTHPYPLYEIVAEVVLLAALWLARRRLAAPGRLFLVAALGYAVIRFSLSVYRQEAVILWGLQEAQVIALATGFIALGLLLARLRLAATTALPER